MAAAPDDLPTPLFDARETEPEWRLRPCYVCDGAKGRFDGDGEWVDCKNCDGHGTQRIPF